VLTPKHETHQTPSISISTVLQNTFLNLAPSGSCFLYKFQAHGTWKPLSKSIPIESKERIHLFMVALRKKANMVKHAGQGPSGICTSPIEMSVRGSTSRRPVHTRSRKYRFCLRACDDSSKTRSHPSRVRRDTSRNICQPSWLSCSGCYLEHQEEYMFQVPAGNKRVVYRYPYPTWKIPSGLAVIVSHLIELTRTAQRFTTSVFYRMVGIFRK
jgi:hypothetical protein